MAKDKHRKLPFIEGNGFPLRSIKPNRNSPCRCGSGKKAKHCCGTRTVTFYSKLNERQKLQAEMNKIKEMAIVPKEEVNQLKETE